MKPFITLIAALSATIIATGAELRLPDIFSDHMVLQQQSKARIWGNAAPGARVEAVGSWAPESPISAKAGKDGRWRLEIPTGEAGFEPQTLRLASGRDTVTISDILIGEVWFASGQSNMEMPLRGFWTQPVEGAAQAIAFSCKYPGIRMATIPKTISYDLQTEVPTEWKISSPENAVNFSATAYFFARNLSDLLNVPVGIICSAYGGSKVEGWLSRERLESYKIWDREAERNNDTMPDYERFNAMYNAMLHPLAGYTIRGFIWNQGESNVGMHDSYHTRLADMVADWRSEWRLGELPFYMVEIAGWNYGNPAGDSAALLRESQHKAADIIPSCGIVCTSDLVYPREVDDIHACKKAEIGERLAFMAAAKTYHMPGIPHEYPRFKEMTVDGSRAILTFSGAPDGLSPHEDIEGFEAAGADGIFHPAQVRQNTWTLHVELYCPKAGTIKSVRYNFRNFAIGKVHNLMGLPLIPFRTDK